jgi:RNA polymerase sigma factor (TIGR02999 family)
MNPEPDLRCGTINTDDAHARACLPALPPGDDLLPLVYEELRKLAAHKMAREAPGQTLQATALVHEAWLRLGADVQPPWQNRAHFFAAAAEAMRRILIDRARARATLKRGGSVEWVSLEETEIPVTTADDDTLLAVNEALEKLAAHHPLQAEVVKLRYFTGMTFEETAAALDISVRTAKARWSCARAWLRLEMRQAT